MSDQLHCPKCNSTQVTAQKHGFSAGKAVAGAVLTGGVGLLAGLHGSSDIDITCLNCGHQWNPKKLSEQRQRQQLEKSAQDHSLWKESFYRAYESRDFEKAAGIYQLKARFRPAVPDVHAAYREQKNSDRQMTVVYIIAFALVVLVGYFLLRWIS